MQSSSSASSACSSTRDGEEAVVAEEAAETAAALMMMGLLLPVPQWALLQGSVQRIQDGVGMRKGCVPSSSLGGLGWW